MIGDDHVFFAASEGIGECDMSRDVSFCAHAINEDGVMVVQDAMIDPRFHDNPLVTDGLIRFYAGVPLKAPSGHALGALCIVDSNPRPPFGPADRIRLRELAGIVTDKLELRRLEVQAMAQPSHFDATAAKSPNAVICFDESMRITAWNEAAITMFGYDEEHMLGQTVDRIIASDDQDLVRAAIARVRIGGAPITDATPLTGERATGERFAAEIHWSHWTDKGATNFGAIVRDVTNRRGERDLLFRLANYDVLTGLANRNMLRTHITATLDADSQATLLVVDLGGFGDINNTLGHAAGDTVLRALSERLSNVVREGEMLARIGGAIFAVLALDSQSQTIDALSWAILAAIAEPMIVDGHEVRLTGYIGIAAAPRDGTNSAELIGSAELALFQARMRGPGSHFHFIPSLRAEAVARRMYDAELHRAFERHEFCLFYQPQVRLVDGALTGAEALIRWQHPLRGLLQPAAFLTALEAGVLAVPVGLWVLNEACAQAAIWRRHKPWFRIGVNLSTSQFRSGDLVSETAQALARHQLPASALELEITENILLDGDENIIAQLEALRALGVSLSFDDFGTGFASLNLLRTVPVDHIKIDKSFTQLVSSAHQDQVIVSGLVDMARRLDINVIAEGVETEADAAFLRAQGCEEAQGYLFGRPVPSAIFTEIHFGECAAATG